MVQLPGGEGRQMVGYSEKAADPIRGTPTEVAEQIRQFADVGAAHVQLVVDPISRESIEWFSAMFDVLDA
jgi:alkanesulfonate monooxygenase SsuD/methylene tetrahydromethanopterin reductase-like flavin-dependent oxidoreductase (luciferase family)